jgi:hypothetical protein
VLIGSLNYVLKLDWLNVVEAMKQHYNVVAIGLIQKLEQQFPTQDLMNAIGVIILKFGCNSS